jgi:hypothetical protein
MTREADTSVVAPAQGWAAWTFFSCRSAFCFLFILLFNFYYHIIVVLGVHCDIYKSAYNIF